MSISPAVIKGIDEVLSERGYSMILMDSNESIAKEQTYAQLLYRKADRRSDPGNGLT